MHERTHSIRMNMGLLHDYCFDDLKYLELVGKLLILDLLIVCWRQRL